MESARESLEAQRDARNKVDNRRFEAKTLDEFDRRSYPVVPFTAESPGRTMSSATLRVVLFTVVAVVSSVEAGGSPLVIDLDAITPSDGLTNQIPGLTFSSATIAFGLVRR
jgi:hypothetical protein